MNNIRLKASPKVTLILALLFLNVSGFSQIKAQVLQDKHNKLITMSDRSGDLVMRLNYQSGCSIDNIRVKGIEVTGNGNRVWSGILQGDRLLTSLKCNVSPDITVSGNSVQVSGIKIGTGEFAIEEKWTFKINETDIHWLIERQYLSNGTVDENYFPCWQFNSMQTWDGAMLDNGGVAWNRFLDRAGDSYGADAGVLTFWNRTNNGCLRITPQLDPRNHGAVSFTHRQNHILSVVQTFSSDEIKTNSGLRRFVQSGKRVFAPTSVAKSGIRVDFTLKALAYDKEFDRGELRGINESSVNEILNTIGRYGVVDRDLFGSNGWRTGYAVLQEPWFALFGLAIDSPDFIRGFSESLEYDRKTAILPDGRVLPRWHHDSTDAMPGTYRKDGFYECQWGYMLDSQPAFVINIAEQFDMTGDYPWLRKFKTDCEKVLEYMIKRDSDGNGLYEVVQKSHTEQKGTDWYDVVWVSYEAASINAYMYMALIRWSEMEMLMGDRLKAERYRQLALKLKTTFNKTIADGGFWNPEKKWYVHWREKDGSVYGNNLASMVNFLAIGYGLCDDPDRKDAILSRIEELMQTEKLFVWPSCFFPYEENVGLKNVNYPWPNYENGDLFLSWAELGTRCYAAKNPEIALKYIRNVIDRYEHDGLGFQRYTRLKQTGEGDDILSNNIMAIVGLYRNIYGIQPRYNRLYLEPHLTGELDGTKLNYLLRNQNYSIDLSKDRYSVSVNNFTVSFSNPFAVSSKGDELSFFNADEGNCSLKLSTAGGSIIEIHNWENGNRSWYESCKNVKSAVHHEVTNLEQKNVYLLLVNDKQIAKYTPDSSGTIRFDIPVGPEALKIQLKN